MRNIYLWKRLTVFKHIYVFHFEETFLVLQKSLFINTNFLVIKLLFLLYNKLHFFQNQKSLTGEVSVFVRLCVAVKRKLQFYYWKNDSFLELQPEIIVNDVPRCISWCQETLCIGFKGDYSLLNVGTFSNFTK